MRWQMLKFYISTPWPLCEMLFFFSFSLEPVDSPRIYFKSINLYTNIPYADCSRKLIWSMKTYMTWHTWQHAVWGERGKRELLNSVSASYPRLPTSTSCKEKLLIKLPQSVALIELHCLKGEIKLCSSHCAFFHSSLFCTCFVYHPRPWDVVILKLILRTYLMMSLALLLGFLLGGR